MLERVTSEVRFRFEGDAKTAQGYAGYARMLLGVLKNQMSFNKLLQLSRQFVLDDGTVIFVQSVFGQDTIQITPAAAQQQQQQQHQLDVGAIDIKQLSHGIIVVGSADTKSVLWKNGAMTVLTGGTKAEGCSADGRIIAGGRSASGTNTTNTGVWWRNGVPADLPGVSGRDTYVTGISADGTTIVGQLATRAEYNVSACRWVNGALTILHPLQSTAHGVSADGRIVVGFASLTVEGLDGQAVYWRNGELHELDYLPGYTAGGAAYSISGDGTSITGICYDSTYYGIPVVWRHGVPEVVDGSGLGRYVTVNAISENGEVLVGTGTRDLGDGSGNTPIPICWRKGDIVHLHFTGSQAAATSVSADGNVIVGWNYYAGHSYAVYWVKNTEYAHYEYLVGDFSGSIAYGVTNTA